MARDLFSFHSSIDSELLVRDVDRSYRLAAAEQVLHAAQRVLGEQLHGTEVLSSPGAVRDFLRVKLGALEHEVFAALMLDAQNRLIECVELFRGTVSQTSVYPREVVKESLARNAAALIARCPIELVPAVSSDPRFWVLAKRRSIWHTACAAAPSKTSGRIIGAECDEVMKGIPPPRMGEGSCDDAARGPIRGGATARRSRCCLTPGRRPAR